MTREQALELLKQHVQADNLRKHCLATEAVMRELAARLGRDVDLWGLAGLLHDLDFEETRKAPESHGLITANWLEARGLPEELIEAVKRHNAEALGLQRETVLDFALTAAETITGLIVAAALVHPDRKIGSLKVKSVLKRMKSKDFARNVNRDHIALCERIPMPLADFVALSIDAMAAVGDELGL